ncbi:MAG: AraC family transcriptional regulator [Bacteroidota bacterium]
MKALPFKIPMPEEASVRVQEDRSSHFYDRLHFHPELQLTLIAKGYGSGLVGNQMVDFGEGDLFLLGSNLPHLFKCDESFYAHPERGVYAISLFFREESFGERFWRLPELYAIRDLLRQSTNGLSLRGAAQSRLRQGLLAMPRANAFERLWGLLDLLRMASELERIPLSNWESTHWEGEGDERLRRVLQYLMDHLGENIRLETVASIANLSPSAFCRFFKLRTRKTLVQFLNEVRIGLACRLLREEEQSIASVAYQVGFQNLSNFNRQFRRIRGTCPTAWRRGT